MADEEKAKGSTTQTLLGVGAIAAGAVTLTGFAGPADISLFAERVGIPFTILVVVLYGLKAGVGWFAKKVFEPLVKSQQEFVQSVAEQNKLQTGAIVEIKGAIQTISNAVSQQAEDHRHTLKEIKDAVEKQTRVFTKIKDVA